MKFFQNILILALIAGFNSQPKLFGQSKSEEIIFKAMKDELNRNMTQLTLDKHKPPFYITYQTTDSKTLYIKASLGSLVQSQQNYGRQNYMRLMVGDYSLNDENFNGGGGARGTAYLPMPEDDDYAAIRRAFWVMTDNVYKSAINNYEHKLTALKQQTDYNNEKLDDFSRITPVTMLLKEVPFDCNKAQWEKAAKDISAEFKAFKNITSSSVNVFVVNNLVYYTTSEGTTLKYPQTIAYLSVNAETIADDGEPIGDYLAYFASTPDQLPTPEKIRQDITQLTSNLTALSKAPAIQDSYSGPLVFEESAAAGMFTSLFNADGLIATREPLSANAGPSVGNANKFEGKMNQRVCPENITITSIPKTRVFQNIPLVGSYEVDAEGVVPKDELTLVDRGILKTLLNNRVPTKKVKESNGHCRVDLLRGGTGRAPGVIDIQYNKGKSLKALYKIAQKEAKKNGLNYFYVVRKFDANAENPFYAGNSSSKPVLIYKVSVKTGEEQLVRSAYIDNFQVTDFKKIIGGTEEQFVYNTIDSGDGAAVPASYITPRAVVFSDISIEKDNGTKPKKPEVPNPLEEVK